MINKIRIENDIYVYFIYLSLIIYIILIFFKQASFPKKMNTYLCQYDQIHNRKYIVVWIDTKKKLENCERVL